MEGLVSRQEWGAMKPRWTKNMTPPIDIVRPTFTDTDYSFEKETAFEILQQLQQKAINKMNLPDIQWNFIIGTDGTIYEGRGWFVEGYKSKLTKNEFGDQQILEVGFIGRIDGVLQPIEASMALRRLVRHGVDKGYIVIDRDILPVGTLK